MTMQIGLKMKNRRYRYDINRPRSGHGDKYIRYKMRFTTIMIIRINPLSANPTKWSNTLKQFVGNLTTNCLSVFDYFVKLALKGLSNT